ncbi:hypothetical protein IGI04_021903 [Brassica rapa subsp. trilocularis]|uniref:Glucose-methanol-choline oxidoreductase N-terminal domain-containing protein n=1 Tax=Brassica rapa subsp. trilocularis TaxID=1813537 RepID=A0ABQ7M0U8_BRACM|nr:hypothetical protein IGI04_021903 [Brassica rapa subsp. trilocularis]
MLSGVGPSAQLQAQNITVVMDQPHVGQGMHDNPMNAVFIPSPVPVEVSLIEVVGITGEGTYVEAAGGENFGGGVGSGNFIRVKFKEVIISPTFSRRLHFRESNGPTIHGSFGAPNPNLNDNPVVTFNYFQHPDDLNRCVRGIQTIERVVQSKAFARGPRASLPPSAEEFCQHTDIRLQRFGITMEDVLLVESSMGIIRLLVYGCEDHERERLANK